MYAEIHAGEGNDGGQGKANGAHPLFATADGDADVTADGGLGVSRREGISRCGLAGGFHDGEARVTLPRAQDAAGDFEELVDINPEKSREQDEIALLFVHTPEHEHAEHDEQHFVAELGQDKHDGVQDGVTDGFQKIQKFHGWSCLLCI